MHLYLDGKSSDSSGSGLVWSRLCSVFWKYSVISAAPLHRQTPHTHICILLKIGSNWKYNKQKSLAETKQKQSRYYSYIKKTIFCFCLRQSSSLHSLLFWAFCGICWIPASCMLLVISTVYIYVCGSVEHVSGISIFLAFVSSLGLIRNKK